MRGIVKGGNNEGGSLPKGLPSNFLDGLIVYPIEAHGFWDTSSSATQTFLRDFMVKNGAVISHRDYTTSLGRIYLTRTDEKGNGMPTTTIINTSPFSRFHSEVVANVLYVWFFTSGSSPSLKRYSLPALTLLSTDSDTLTMYNSTDYATANVNGVMYYGDAGYKIYKLVPSGSSVTRTEVKDIQSKIISLGTLQAMALKEVDGYLYVLCISWHISSSKRNATLIKYSASVGGVLTEISTVALPPGLSGNVPYVYSAYPLSAVIDADYVYAHGDFETAGVMKMYKINALTGAIVLSSTSLQVDQTLSGRYFCNLNEKYLVRVVNSHTQPSSLTLIDKATFSLVSNPAASQCIGSARTPDDATTVAYHSNGMAYVSNETGVYAVAVGK